MSSQLRALFAWLEAMGCSRIDPFAMYEATEKYEGRAVTSLSVEECKELIKVSGDMTGILKLENDDQEFWQGMVEELWFMPGEAKERI